MPKNDPIDVFKYIDMRGPDECHQWKGTWGGQPRDKRPYFMSDRRRMISYRWVYELVHGVTLAPDQLLLHSCDNGGAPVGCCNVAHLRIGSVQENSDDMTSRERHGFPKTIVNNIRRLLSEGRPQTEIATLYGCSRETISAIATQRVYKHLPKEQTNDEEH